MDTETVELRARMRKAAVECQSIAAAMSLRNGEGEAFPRCELRYEVNHCANSLLRVAGRLGLMAEDTLVEDVKPPKKGV